MSERAWLRAPMTDALPRLVDDVVVTIQEQIPAYAALTPAQLDEVAAIARWGIDRIVELWIDGGRLGAADERRFRGIGSARALDGRSLPGVLRAYRLAGSRVTELVTEVAGDRLTVRDAMALARLWMDSMDALSEAVHAGYVASSERMTHDRDRALADLLDDLLSGRQATVTALVDRCRELGVDLPVRPHLLVLSGPEDAALPDLRGVILQSRRGAHAVLVLDAPPPDLAGALSVAGARGCLVSGHERSRLSRAHRLAELALAHAPAYAFARTPLLDEGDALVLALLAGGDLADPEHVVAQVLGELRGAGREHLLEGLAAYVAVGSATEAATVLGLHTQSLRHRLRRAHEVAGRDPRDPWDRFVLQTALTLSGR